MYRKVVSCGVWKLEWSKDMGKGFLQQKNLLIDTLGKGGGSKFWSMHVIFQVRCICSIKGFH